MEHVEAGQADTATVVSRRGRHLAVLGAGLFAALLVTTARPAQAQFLNLGGSMQVSGTNAPNTFSETDTLSTGTTAIDSGLLSFTLSLVAGSGGSQWVIFGFQTASGITIAGDPTANWELAVSNAPLLQSAIIAHFYVDWGTNGTLGEPTSNGGGNLPLETYPVTGSGTVLGENIAIPPPLQSASLIIWIRSIPT